MKVQDMVNAFLTASREDQASFLKLVQSMKRKSAKEQVDNSGPERRLYEAVRQQMLSLIGVRLPPYDSLCKGSDARARLETAVRWLQYNPHKEKLTRTVEQALFSLAADAVAHEIRKDMSPTPSKEETLRLLASIPRATDRAFPMYRANGLLLCIAQKAAAGELPLIRVDDDEEEWAT